VESKPPVESKPAAVVTPAASPAAKHPTPAASLPEPSIAEPGPSAADAPPAVAARTSEPVDHRTPEIVTTRTQEETPARETEIPLHPQTPVTAPPPLDTGKVRNLKPGRGEGGGAKPTPRHRPPLRPVMRNIATPPPLKPSLARPEKDKSKEPTQKPIARPVEAIKGGQVSVKEIINKLAVAPGKAVPPPDADEDELDAKGKKKRPGQVVGRDTRHKLRNERAEKRKQETDAKVRGGQVIIEEEEARPRLKQRARAPKPVKQPITLPRKGKVPIELPITVRSLSAAIGVPAGALLFKLRDHGALPTVNINSTLEPELAEVIALDVGIELDIKRPVDSEEQLLAELAQPTNPEDLRPRAPVVTIMGHVDHGKTSLLDKIRQSNVVATEAGGITQVIRAWRVEHGGRPVTFLDTPGHEAFTKMRARGAQVTDVAVIVVAADDGVMPQTEEAINHAKAAGVPIVVAINKVDLPNANLNRTRQQLYGMELIPDNMGGDVPFVETSAATGKGIDELLDVLSLVAEMRELKANPTGPGRGTCLEAMLSEDEGVRATLLVQSGTLHRGDVILCGATYGRVRAMYDDLGRPIQEAGPSVPVRITGLDEVPNADDPFQVVPDLALARSIAERRKSRQQEAALVKPRVFSLETLAEIKIAELKVILKADFRGSIEAIRKELDKLHHEEVRVRILHTGIGAITESDVQLALASPSDTVIIGFNVVPDDRAQALAEEKGISLRLYNVIYQLTDDIKAALEGKLKPREEIVHLGRAVVREIFKISRIGTIAGCYVTQGTIERSAKVRLIRQGVVIYPPPDRTASLDSLKRFKDDVREVREGFECGLKIAGYDDLKVDDVIEAYKIEQVQRTL
ncbi:MAG: translation initiation factor IF-2, partial [Gemmataceae bacterium]